ncbi:cytochrome P450 [Microdochium bolleyi]|uniref:Cytochrome P450 n=1 Tax=Microdochium bolleyi TaxID=196109 RepID=A0A136IQM5_9PEZI|nr:cytochrome P450 [Microdochium bolleyi]
MSTKGLLGDRLELAVPAGTLLLGALLIIPWLSQARADAAYPLVGKEVGAFYKRQKHFLQHAIELHREGYSKFRDSIFQITESDGNVIILPRKYFEELRKLPDDIINNVVALDTRLETHYTGLSSDNPLVNHIIRSDLTHNLPKINYLLSDEVAKTVPEYLGTSREWQSVNINTAVLKMVAIVSGHVFIGPEHNRSEAYLHASINYTIDIFNAAAQLKTWPKLLRPIGQYFVPGVETVKEHRRRAQEFLVPIINERRARLAAGEQVPDDVLQWTIAKAHKFGITDDAALADGQLTLSLAAIHTTTMMATHIIYDLIGTCPEVIPELRQEIKTVLEENDNILTTQALYQMKLLDSVMRESQRTNIISATVFKRQVLKDVVLSDGTRLPAGASIAVPNIAPANDPALYPEPERFNPYRFYDLRSGKVADPLNYSNKEQYQFISVSKENMAFGYGRHSCPGRFFAANEIKLLVARILLDYDFKMPDGVTGRYKNIVQGGSISVDPRKEVMMRYVGE